jgi:hypothetical protein
MLGHNMATFKETITEDLKPEEIQERVKNLREQIEHLKQEVAAAPAIGYFLRACHCRDHADALKSIIHALNGGKT